MVPQADMVNTVLGSSVPLRTPRHRAPPQLSQVQVICGYVVCHVMYNVSPTIRASPCLRITKPALVLPPHQLQVDMSSCHPINRDVGHCRRKFLISPIETVGPGTLVISTSVTSWNPRDITLASGTSTQTLFWVLPGSTRVGLAYP